MITNFIFELWDGDILTSQQSVANSVYLVWTYFYDNPKLPFSLLNYKWNIITHFKTE